MQTSLIDMTKGYVTEILVQLGRKLGFEIGTEVQASDSAWVDVVWFDDRFDFGPKKEGRWVRVKTWRQPVLPVVGFEIEASAGAKTFKGSVANLNDLGPLMGIIVISEENIDKMRKRADLWSKKSTNEIWKELVRRAIQWVHEARPIVRIVVMTEAEIRQWWRRLQGSPLPRRSGRHLDRRFKFHE